jgi:hypothetical protein
MNRFYLTGFHGRKMKLRIILSFLFFPSVLVNYFTYASQLSPSDNLVTYQSITDKFILSESVLQDIQLTKVRFESKHLDLFDRDHVLQGNNRTASSKQQLLVNNLKMNIEGEMQETRIRSVVTSGAYLDEIFNAAKEYNIDPLLLHAIAEIESSYNPFAISPAGAKGLMQIMPATARRFGMQNPDTELLDPGSNLRISSNYLRTLHSLFGNNLTLILAAYNAGENAVIRYGYAIPPYRETQQYVTKVMNRYLELKSESMQF